MVSVNPPPPTASEITTAPVRHCVAALASKGALLPAEAMIAAPVGQLLRQ